MPRSTTSLIETNTRVTAGYGNTGLGVPIPTGECTSGPVERYAVLPNSGSAIACPASETWPRTC